MDDDEKYIRKILIKSIKVLKKQGNDYLIKDAVREYKKVLKQFVKHGDKIELYDRLFYVKDTYHCILNAKYHKRESYNKNFVIPIQQLRCSLSPINNIK